MHIFVQTSTLSASALPSKLLFETWGKCNISLKWFTEEREDWLFKEKSNKILFNMNRHLGGSKGVLWLMTKSSGWFRHTLEFPNMPYVACLVSFLPLILNFFHTVCAPEDSSCSILTRQGRDVVTIFCNPLALQQRHEVQWDCCEVLVASGFSPLHIFVVLQDQTLLNVQCFETVL